MFEVRLESGFSDNLHRVCLRATGSRIGFDVRRRRRRRRDDMKIYSVVEWRENYFHTIYDCPRLSQFYVPCRNIILYGISFFLHPEGNFPPYQQCRAVQYKVFAGKNIWPKSSRGIKPCYYLYFFLKNYTVIRGGKPRVALNEIIQRRRVSVKVQCTRCSIQTNRTTIILENILNALCIIAVNDKHIFYVPEREWKSSILDKRSL